MNGNEIRADVILTTQVSATATVNSEVRAIVQSGNPIYLYRNAEPITNEELEALLK